MNETFRSGRYVGALALAGLVAMAAAPAILAPATSIPPAPIAEDEERNRRRRLRRDVRTGRAAELRRRFSGTGRL